MQKSYSKSKLVRRSRVFRGSLGLWRPRLVFWTGALAIGVTSAALMRFTFSIWTFWTERSWALSRLYYQFYSFATKPDGLYPKSIRLIILTLLPFAFIGSVPARALLEGLTPREYIQIVVTLGSFFFINRHLWRKGLQRYQSASS